VGDGVLAARARAWNGCTPTDLVFPFLLFAMGAAVPFAMARRRGVDRRMRRHVVRRALVLFALGLLLNGIESSPLAWSTFRIPGVLQRIAIVYAAVAALTERTSWRTQAVVALGALLGYWALMTLVPVPGAGRGVLTPEGNLAGYLDRSLLGAHLANPRWDPEGLVSTLPAIATALAGVFAGDWLNRRGSAPHRTATLCAAGLAAAAIGLAWDAAFPINKNLWTSSFALFSAGLAGVVLAAAHWVLDVKGWRAWAAPFQAFGRNPLDAVVARRRRVGEERDLPARVSAVGEAARRRRSGVARLCARIRRALGGRARRDAPQANLRRNMKYYCVHAVPPRRDRRAVEGV
jgi:predicted acyltransferase